MTSFLSTFENKVDRKGRVSVPAPFRTVLAGESFQGIIAYQSLVNRAAIDAFGRGALEELNRRNFDRTMQSGDFEAVLLGGNSVVDTIMAMAHELPFDSEGRIVLPPSLAEAAGITDRATFVGRGNRFQIWAPAAFARHRDAEIEALRTRLARDRGGLPT